jgi:hypothetical protein
MVLGDLIWLLAGACIGWIIGMLILMGFMILISRSRR